MNLKVLITLIAGIVIAIIGAAFHVDVPTEVKEGFIVGIITVAGLLAHEPSDPTGVRTNIVSLVFAICWIVTVAFKIEISNPIKEMIAGAITTLLASFISPIKTSDLTKV